MQRCYGCMKEYGEDFNVCPYCGYIADTVPESKFHLRPGTCLADKYVLGRVIGHGGFGITYIAYDKVIQKRVAVKEFFPNAFSTRSEGELAVSCYNRKSEEFLKEGIRKMLEEAKRLSSFSATDNVVDIFDFFEANNTAYIVMEYLDGKDLKKLLEENGGSLKPERAIEIIMPVLNALEDMHKEKVIHRDISPDNIFICGNGKVKLLDFGSARLAVDDSEKSLSVMVKRGYAPREQYASRSKQGPWTDVYAVCATLYRMITGETPLESTERDEEQLKPFSAFGIKGYDSLEALLAQGLVVDYTKRIQSATELKNALTKILEGKKPVGIHKKKSKKTKKIIKAAVVAAASVAVLVGAAFAIKYFVGNAPKVEETTTTAEPQTVAAAELKISEKEATELYDGYLKSSDFAKENPALNGFVNNSDSVYNGSDLKPEDLLVFDSEPMDIIPGSAAHRKDYFDLDGDGVSEMLLSVSIRLKEGKDRMCVALFDIDTENGNKVFKGAQWEKISSSDTSLNHLSIIKNTDEAVQAPYYFAEFSYKNQLDEEAPETEDYSKDGRKTSYNGKELVQQVSISIADYQLKGLAQPRFIKCTLPEKSLYMTDPEGAEYPAAQEVERLTYEAACEEWKNIFGGSREYGYCDEARESLLKGVEKLNGNFVNEDIIWSWYENGYLLVEIRDNEIKTASMPNKVDLPAKTAKKVGITSGITDIAPDMFSGFSELTAAFISEGVTEIGAAGFMGCENLSQLSLPDSLITVEDSAFSSCTGLGAVELPKNLAFIGASAFMDCGSLVSINIPVAVSNIGDNAFYSTESLESINVEAGNSYYSSIDGVLFNKSKTELIKYPEARRGDVYAVPEGVRIIGEGAFANAHISGIRIPGTVEVIDEYAFLGCDRLKTVYYTTEHLVKKPEIRANNQSFKNARVQYN